MSLGQPKFGTPVPCGVPAVVVFVDTSILVVDDDLAVQEFIAGVLRLEGGQLVELKGARHE